MPHTQLPKANTVKECHPSITGHGDDRVIIKLCILCCVLVCRAAFCFCLSEIGSYYIGGRKGSTPRIQRRRRRRSNKGSEQIRTLGGNAQHLAAAFTPRWRRRRRSTPALRTSARTTEKKCVRGREGGAPSCPRPPGRRHSVRPSVRPTSSSPLFSSLPLVPRVGIARGRTYKRIKRGEGGDGEKNTSNDLDRQAAARRNGGGRGRNSGRTEEVEVAADE